MSIDQPNLFGDPDDLPDEHYDGDTYDPERDHDRLRTQHKRVLAAMLDHGWHTLAEVAQSIGAPEASVSARLRDLRKEKFGGWTVERKYIRKGLHAYRLAEEAEVTE